MDRTVDTLLIVNPASDRDFAALAGSLVRSGVLSPADLRVGLRKVYPRAEVHTRQLDGEQRQTWYVYREGHWIGTGRGAAARSDGATTDAATLIRAAARRS